MEILIIVFASVILPIFVTSVLVYFNRKVAEDRRDDKELIDTLEKIVETKSETINDLL